MDHGWPASRRGLGVTFATVAVFSALVVAPVVRSAAPVSAAATAAVHSIRGLIPSVLPGLVARPREMSQPTSNTTMSPTLAGSCALIGLDTSSGCLEALISATNSSRAAEGVEPIELDVATFQGLSVPEQLFVIANLERVGRGLAPIVGMTAQLDSGAESAAVAHTDPSLSLTTLTGGASIVQSGSNWAGGYVDPLGADYSWMYDDGYGGPNLDCPAPGAPACWGHRDNILFSAVGCGHAPPVLVMGAGFYSTGTPSYAETFVEACGASPTDLVFTWSEAEATVLGTSGAGTTANDSATSLITATGSSSTPSSSAAHRGRRTTGTRVDVAESASGSGRSRTVALVVAVTSGTRTRSVLVEKRPGATWSVLTRRRTSPAGLVTIRLHFAGGRVPTIRVVVTATPRSQGTVATVRPPRAG